MADAGSRFLVIGYGNPGRLDDGIGPALAEELEPLASEVIAIDSDYQLQVEHAEAASHRDVVIFVDASVSGPEPFYVEEIAPMRAISFSSHSLGPAEVLGLTHELFCARTRGFVIGIRGYEFDAFGERISVRARINMNQAKEFLETVLKDGGVAGLARRGEGSFARGNPAT